LKLLWVVKSIQRGAAASHVEGFNLAASTTTKTGAAGTLPSPAPPRSVYSEEHDLFRFTDGWLAEHAYLALLGKRGMMKGF
jgi:hypothetical protein